MSTLINTILVGIGFLASLATIIAALAPLVQQYIYKQQLDAQAKARQQKFTRIVLVSGLLIASIIFIIASLFQPPAAAPSETIRGTLLSSFAASGATDISYLAWSPDSKRL